MKVAIVRGPSLSKWEMQIYEPLAKKLKLLGVGSRRSDHDLREISFAYERLHCAGEYLAFLPGGIDWLYHRFGDPQILIAFDRIVDGYDIVHAAELRSYYSLQAVLAKRAGLVRVVTLTVYENIPFLGDEIPARQRLKAEVILGVDHFLAANEKAREALLAEGVEEGRISVVGQAVDTRRFAPGEDLKLERSAGASTHPAKGFDRMSSRSLPPGSLHFREMHRPFGKPVSSFTRDPAGLRDPQTARSHRLTRESFRFGKHDIVVLAVGRMVWEKGWYDIIRSAHKVQSEKFPTSLKLRGAGKVQSEKRRIRFLFVGEGSERKRLEEMVRRLGLGDTVHFAGRVLYSQMPEVFRLADLFVLASLPTRDWNEQFGGVLIEAMATGLPVVGTLNGGTAQTVEGEDISFRSGQFIGKGGIFVPPQDFSRLADAIVKLAADPGLRDKMGARNRRRAVERFDNRVIAGKIYRVWRKVL